MLPSSFIPKKRKKRIRDLSNGHTIPCHLGKSISKEGTAGCSLVLGNKNRANHVGFKNLASSK